MPLRVVLVDDDRRFRAMALRVLVADGVEVVALADDGAEALTAVAEWRPDVVLLDIGLPDVNGVEVARQLRAEAEAENEGGPVVILISTRDLAYGRRVAAGVAAGYVRKQDLSLAAIVQIARLAP